MKKPRSQIAVLITFVLAAIILFIVVFINITKVSTIKTSSSQASDRAALGLASQIGSMSHYYKDKVVKGGTEKIIDGKKVIEACGDWLPLVVLIGIVVGIFYPPVALVAAGVLVVNMALSDEINAKFKEMTSYNGLRETALFEALSSLQSDNVSLLLKGSGIFYDDINNNKSFETGEPEYNLSPIAGMLNQKKVGRFFAWYYAKRLPLVLEKDDALKNKTITFVNELKDLVNDVGVWEASNKDALKLIKLSYTIGPGADLANFEITKDTTWADLANKRIRIVTIKETEKDKNNNYKTTGGFLKEKLISLGTRLEDAGYNLSFCSNTGCSAIDEVIKDLTTFLSRIKGVLDTPRSLRLKNVTEWLPLFYDSDKHDQEDKDADGDKREPKDPSDPKRFDYDIYLRLTQDQNHINRWITELETLNNEATTGIKDVIKKAHGECSWGQGTAVAQCLAGWCCGEYSCWCCNPKTDCAWEGIYYTCCQNPPVCNDGDLYSTKPPWCDTHKDRKPKCKCSCPKKNFNCDDAAKSFQGQLAYDNTSGPTEVEQAIRILRALEADITGINGIKNKIGDFAEAVKALTKSKLTKSKPSEPPDLRNKIVYAWKDAPAGEGKSQLSHLVHVKIEGKDVKGKIVPGYLDKDEDCTDKDCEGKDLPHVIEKGWVEKCYILEDYKGSFQISTSRYDQDIPLPQWNLRRRRKGPLEAGKEFSPEFLGVIVADIQDNGKLDSKVTEDGVKYVLDNFAITSETKAYYGPEKSDIYIEKVK